MNIDIEIPVVNSTEPGQVKRRDSHSSFDDFIKCLECEEHRKASVLSKIKNTKEHGSPKLVFSKHTVSTNSNVTDVEDADEAEDVRRRLFQSIPEPYIDDILSYQRVIVTETTEPPDNDTIEACRRLHTCVELRSKWLGVHPYPPQDVHDSFERIDGKA